MRPKNLTTVESSTANHRSPPSLRSERSISLNQSIPEKGQYRFASATSTQERIDLVMAIGSRAGFVRLLDGVPPLIFVIAARILRSPVQQKREKGKRRR